MALGVILAALHRPPDLMIDGTGRMAALRGAGGGLVFAPVRGDRRARETWAQMGGQGTDTPDWSAADGVRCDALGCVWRRPGHVIALGHLAEAVKDDCQTADLVVVPVPMFAPCPSATLLLDGLRLRRGGTHAIWLDGEASAPRVLTVAQWQGSRPWNAPPPRRPAGPAIKEEEEAPAAETAGSAANTDASAPPDDPEP
jgi:competence protein ComEC